MTSRLSRSEVANSLKILIAGFGSIGRRHWQNLVSLGFRDFVFYRTGHGTVDDALIREWPSYTNLADALACGPELAVVANPTSLHVQTALQALEANCHLLIEKPLSHSLESCDQLAELAVTRRRTVLIGCQLRFHPLLRRLRQDIIAGRLGEVFGARAEWGEYLPAWHPWEDYRQSYSSRDDLGGGVILTLIHPIDYLQWLFGKVTQVQAITRSLDYLATPAGEDSADLLLQFGSRVVAQAHLDYHQRPPVHALKVWGEQGRAICDFQAGTLEWTDVQGATASESTPAGFERNTLFIDEMKHFLSCAQGKEEPLIPLRDGISALEVALAAKHRAHHEARELALHARQI